MNEDMKPTSQPQPPELHAGKRQSYAALNAPDGRTDSRNLILIIGIALVSAASLWMLARELIGVRSRLAGISSPAHSREASAAEPAHISYDEVAMASSGWFHAPALSRVDVPAPADIPRAPIEEKTVNEPVRAAQVRVEPEPEQIAVRPLSPMKLSGVVLGAQMRKAIADIDGQKRIIEIGNSLGEWKLVELALQSATFESPVGVREIVYMYPNAP